MNRITDFFEENKDEKYAQFQRKLIPTLNPEAIIGVRTPILRKFAKELKRDDTCVTFLQELPHRYFEENQLHGFIISEIPDFQSCILETERFLPYMDNWATCDQTSPKVFRKHREELLPYIKKWLASEHTYTVRFAIGMLMRHFLDEDFNVEYSELVAGISSDEYYINMEIAWYIATALAKQWAATIPYIENNRLDPWVHNKTIQKARESNRITKKQKEYLKQLKV
ncbi:MAG: DNA alkylation repair protein [Eubacteriales bacterium]|nr:DNA alkylation repair protein [Eubacteriales bacterium]